LGIGEGDFGTALPVGYQVSLLGKWFRAPAGQKAGRD